jgi:hypothetical protein
VASWAAPLLYILEVLGSGPGLETGYPEGFKLFFSDLESRLGYDHSVVHPSDLLFMNYPTI